MPDHSNLRTTVQRGQNSDILYPPLPSERRRPTRREARVTSAAMNSVRWDCRTPRLVRWPSNVGHCRRNWCWPSGTITTSDSRTRALGAPPFGWRCWSTELAKLRVACARRRTLHTSGRSARGPCRRSGWKYRLYRPSCSEWNLRSKSLPTCSGSTSSRAKCTP